MSILVLDIWLAIAGIVLSGLTMGVLLIAKRSFGAYTERIERSNVQARQAIEKDRQERDRAREHNIAILRELMKIKADLDSNTQRSA